MRAARGPPSRRRRSAPLSGGCAAFELSARRCAAIVERLAEDQGITPEQAARIELLGDPGCEGTNTEPQPCLRTTAFVVRARFHLPDGRILEASQFCGPGGQFSLLCTEHPEVRVSTTMDGYRDIPCWGEPPDGCPTPHPEPDPATAARERPIVRERLEIPIDHEGGYAVDLGVGALANGILDTASLTLADGARDVLLAEGGIRLDVESLEPDGRPFDNYYLHGRRDGVERISARITFEVLSFEPGASIVLTGIVVR